MLPVANNPEIVLPKLKVQANEVYSTLFDKRFDFETVEKAVRKHQDHQRYARQAARASAFFKHVNGKTDPATMEGRLNGFFQVLFKSYRIWFIILVPIKYYPRKISYFGDYSFNILLTFNDLKFSF